MSAGKRKRVRWIILLAVILAVGGMILFRKDAAQVYEEAVVTTGDIRTTYSFTGSVVAPHTQTVVAAAPGKVREVYVEGNARVASGERLLGLSGGEILRAEMDGEVAWLNVRKDDQVAAGAVLAVILDPDQLEGEILVDEYDVGAIEPGRAVTVTVNALEETVEGTIERLDKQATQHGSMTAYTAHIVFEAPDRTLPGMQIEVKMPNQSAENVSLLKVDALQFDERNQTYVLLKNEEGKYDRAYVETGVNDGVYIEIVSGLEAGQTVYYPPANQLVAMMSMRSGGRR